MNFSDAQRTIRNLFRISHRMTLRDNLPISAKQPREKLAELLPLLDLHTGAEIGVKEGKFSATLCKANPKIKLFCVDVWSAKYGGPQEVHDRYYKHAVAALKPFNATIIRKPSMEAVREFDDASLDFVYIDANHTFDHACADLIFWAQKVRPGGLIGLHDYFHHHRGGVVEAVDAYTYCHRVDPWYVTLEVWPSAFWIKAE